jgi:NAD(P)-dependent dehydrogenase (short-subunit alcohol dehydrogenase family)
MSREAVDERISFEGQVAIITGAAHGLGRSYALELAGRGAAVVVNDVAAEAADAVATEIKESGSRAIASHDSVGTPEGGAAIVRTAVDTFGSLDVIVHNAGTWRNAPLEEMTVEMFDAVLDVHLRGAFFLTQPAWKILIDKGYGRVILTSSSAGAFGRQLGVNYVAAKAGLLGLARALAQEGEHHGIKANAILPSAATAQTRRPMASEYRARMDAAQVAILPRRVPEMVAPFVAYLASRQCAVNGEAFNVGCGYFARVFTGMAAGWVSAPRDPASAEEIMTHLNEIEDRSEYSLPNDIIDDLHEVTRALKAAKAEGLADD